MFLQWLRRNLGTLLTGLALAAVIYLAMTDHDYPYRDYPGTWYQRTVDSGLYQGPLGTAFRWTLTGIERATDLFTGVFVRGSSRTSDTAQDPASNDRHKLLVVVWEGVGEPALNEALRERKMPNYSRLLDLGVRKPLRSDSWTTLDDAFMGLLELPDVPSDATPARSVSTTAFSHLEKEGRSVAVLDPRMRLAKSSRPVAAPRQIYPRTVKAPLPGGGAALIIPGRRHWGVPFLSLLLVLALLAVAIKRMFQGVKEHDPPPDKGGQAASSIFGLLSFRVGFIFAGMVFGVLLLFNILYLLKPCDFLLPGYQARSLVNHDLHPAWDKALAAAPASWEVLAAVHPEALYLEAAFPGNSASRVALMEFLDTRLGDLMTLAGEGTPVLLLLPFDMASDRRVLFAQNWVDWLNRECGESVFECRPTWGGTTAVIGCSGWNAPMKESTEGITHRKWLEGMLDRMMDPLTNHRLASRWRFVEGEAWVEFGPEYWVTPEDRWYGWRYNGRYRSPDEGREFYGAVEDNAPVIRRMGNRWKDTMGPLPGGSMIVADFPSSAFRSTRAVERRSVAVAIYETVSGKRLQTKPEPVKAEPAPGRSTRGR